jgi:hypothetical protein
MAAGRSWRRYVIVSAIAVLGIGVALRLLWGPGGFFTSREPSIVTFDGSSARLPQTVIVPTLDTPAPEGKSVIWCSSIQIAWNHLQSDVAKGPIQLVGAEQVLDRLNRAKESENDLAPESFYAVAGMVTDGIIEKIHAEMGQRFPEVPPPTFDVPLAGAVAFSFLKAGVKFQYPFFDNDAPFLFTDSMGTQNAIRAFGIRDKDEYAYSKLREQVSILVCPKDAIWSEKEVDEFILDPCKDSQPYQLLLAMVKRKQTLADTLADVQRKIGESPANQMTSRIHPRDTLLIPTMNWKIEHRFRELEGEDKVFVNPALRGLHLDTALQIIHFKLDRSGAELGSEFKVYVKPGRSFFHFNKPFLIVLKKRASNRPVFVMWVDNAELLSKL